MTGGLRGQGFLLSVERDLAKLLNGNGKPAGAYKQVLEEVAKAEAFVAALTATRNELKENVEALEATGKRLQALEAGMQADVAEKMIARSAGEKDGRAVV